MAAAQLLLKPEQVPRSQELFSGLPVFSLELFSLQLLELTANSQVSTRKHAIYAK